MRLVTGIVLQCLIYLQSSNWPLQLVLREVLVQTRSTAMISGLDVREMAMRQQLRELLKYSLIVVATSAV